MPLEIDATQLARLERDLRRVAGRKGQREVVRALRDTRRRTGTSVGRDVRTQYAIKARVLSSRLRLSPVDPSRLQFTLRATGRGLNAIEFGTPRQTKKGVAVTFEKGKRTTISSAFIQRGSASGKPLVLIRKYSGGRPVGRYPVRSVWGPTAKQMVDQPRRLDRMEGTFADQLEAQLDRRLLRILRRGS